MAEKSQGDFPRMGGGQMVRPQDLQSMLDQIANLSRQGARAAAQQMLAQLQNMLENLRTPGGQMSAEQKAATEALEKLGEMIGRQRSLMDKTFREQQEAEETLGRDGKPSPLKPEQDKLSDELTAIIKKAGGQDEEAMKALTRAQDAMDEASDQLGNGKLGRAGESQQTAIDEMRRGGEAMAKQLLQQMAGQGANMPGGGGVGGGMNEDPFGRPQSSNGRSLGSSVKVPTKGDIQKAREILEELQRRAAERGRPMPELEYIERLLRRF
jgi:hypothetical protein